MNSSLYYQKINLNLDTAGYYYLEMLCSESMWVFNTLLEGKVASHARHLKVPHDLLWTMSPLFEGNPLTHWKHSWLNCPHLTLTEPLDLEKWDRLNRSELILTRGERSSCPSYDMACRCVSLEPDYNTLSIGAYKPASLRACEPASLRAYEPMSLQAYIAGIFCLCPIIYTFVKTLRTIPEL